MSLLVYYVICVIQLHVKNLKNEAIESNTER